MVVLWIFASLYILGNEFSDFLDHKVDGWNDETSRYWNCYGWPQRGIRKYPCQDSSCCWFNKENVHVDGPLDNIPLRNYFDTRFWLSG